MSAHDDARETESRDASDAPVLVETRGAVLLLTLNFLAWLKRFTTLHF
jgi:hypothetical protein